MSELHDAFDGTAVSARISQPPFAELASRGRRRGHRVRMVRSTGVAVVAALAVIPLLTLPGGDGAHTPASPLPSATPSGGDPGGSYAIARGLSFLDIDHGVVQFSISGSPGPPNCAELLAVTSNGGATWSAFRELPELPELPELETIDTTGCSLTADVLQVTPETLVIPIGFHRVAAYTQAGEEPPTTSFISQDAGQTWQPYEPRVRTADAVPGGLVPRVDCVAGPGEIRVLECRPQLSWYDPLTGDQMIAEHTPPALPDEIPGHGEVAVAADGSIWVTGRHPDGVFHVSVSRDRGRTWLDGSPAQADPDDSHYFGTATYDGDTGYFYWSAESEGPPGPVHLYRTTDGGETWQELPAGLLFADGLQGLWATRDTLVAVDGAGTTYRSDDGGETFDVVELNLPVTAVQPLGGGFHSEHLIDHPASIGLAGALSADGLTWRGYEAPPAPLPAQ